MNREIAKEDLERMCNRLSDGIGDWPYPKNEDGEPVFPGIRLDYGQRYTDTVYADDPACILLAYCILCGCETKRDVKISCARINGILGDKDWSAAFFDFDNEHEANFFGLVMDADRTYHCIDSMKKVFDRKSKSSIILVEFNAKFHELLVKHGFYTDPREWPSWESQGYYGEEPPRSLEESIFRGDN